MNKLITTCNKFTDSFALILSVGMTTLPYISTITFSHEEFMFVLVHMLEMGLYVDKVHMKSHDFLKTVCQLFD